MLLLDFLESGNSASGFRRSLRFEVCTQERIDRHCRVDESLFLFSPLTPPMPPPLCFGDAREGTVGDSTPLAKRGAHPPDQTLSSQLKPTMKIRICGKLFFLGLFFPLKRNPEHRLQA